MSRVVDQHRFDTLPASAVPEPSNVGVMLLDRDFRIRGVNAGYEAISMRHRDQLLGERVLDVFPDDPDNPQASGSSRLAVSVESAMRRGGTDTMSIVRYDITDPQNPDMLMEHYDVDAAAAVDLLVTLSQRSNVRLEDIAQKLVEIDHPGR